MKFSDEYFNKHNWEDIQKFYNVQIPPGVLTTNASVRLVAQSSKNLRGFLYFNPISEFHY